MSSERITLNSSERSLLLPGLEHLVNGIASAKIGRYPHADPMGVVNETKDVYPNRRHHAAMAMRVLSARTKVRKPGQQGKVRLDTWEIAIAALALRIFGSVSGTTCDQDQFRTLQRKLENYRRRTKRAFVRKVGSESYVNEQAHWREFLAWMRFYLCSFTKRRRKTAPLLTYKSHFNQILQLARDVISERSDAVVDPKRLRHVVRLMLGELRRGRHETTPIKILRNPAAAHDFVFSFVEKRIELDPLKWEYKPYCVQAAERTERFEKAKTVESDDAPPARKSIPTMSQPVPEPTVVSFLSEEETRYVGVCLANWLEKVAPELATKIAHAAFMRTFRIALPRCDSFPPLATPELISKLRPNWTPKSPEETLEYFAEWTIAWVQAALLRGRLNVVLHKQVLRDLLCEVGDLVEKRRRDRPSFCLTTQATLRELYPWWNQG